MPRNLDPKTLLQHQLYFDSRDPEQLCVLPVTLLRRRWG